MTNTSSKINQPQKSSFSLNPFKNLNLSWRLGLGLGTLAGLTLLVVILSFIASTVATNNINITSEQRVPSVLTANRAQVSLLEMVSSVRGYLVLGDLQDIDNYNQAQQTFEASLDEIEQNLQQADNIENLQRLTELRTVFESWATLPPQLFELHDNPRKNQPALSLYRTEVRPLSIPILAEIDAIIQLEKQRPASEQNPDLLDTMIDFQNSFEVMMANLQAYALTGDLSFKSGYTTRLPININSWETLQRNRDTFTPEQQAKLDAIALAHEQVLKLAPQIFTTVEGERAFEDLYLFRTQAVPQAQQMLQLLNTLTLDEQSKLEADLNQGRQSLGLAQNQILIGGLVAVILGVSLAFIFRRNIINPVRRLTNVAEQITEGDLNAQAPIESNDEIGVLAGTFNNMTAQLRQSLEDLEAGRQELNRQNQYLGILAVLSERLSGILDLEILLAEVVEQVKEQFDYYHAHIYLIDEDNDYLVVAAGVGQAGAQMKAQGHRILLNSPQSLVARAARTQKVVKVDNVREAEDWLPNPLLPDTYSEMAVPIILDNQTAGVLDVQENSIASLDESDAESLQLLAKQVAVAIRNARLFRQVEKSLTEVRLAQEKYVERSWKGSAAKQQIDYLYAPSSTSTPPVESAIAEAKRLGKIQKQPAVVAVDSNTNKPNTLVAPITLSNKTIGVAHIHQPDNSANATQWTEEDLVFVEAILDQVAQTAENLRLFEETRERAGREQTIREITDRLRAAPSLEMLTKLAGEELGKILGASSGAIKLGIQSGGDAGSNGNGRHQESNNAKL